MNTRSSVVTMWRRRGPRMARQGWACPDCDQAFLVRRRACPACSSEKGMVETTLPARGTVRSLSRAGGSVEHLDQVHDQKPTVLLELDGKRGRLACLLAWSDAGILDSLRDKSLRLAVRRMVLGHLPNGEPIPYGLKAAADLRTRLEIKQAEKEAAKEA